MFRLCWEVLGRVNAIHLAALVMAGAKFPNGQAEMLHVGISEAQMEGSYQSHSQIATCRRKKSKSLIVIVTKPFPC